VTGERAPNGQLTHAYYRLQNSATGDFVYAGHGQAALLLEQVPAHPTSAAVDSSSAAIGKRVR
jgi:hypothetical protein